MRLNIEKLRALMQEKCGGNYNAFARETGINVALIYRILNEQGNAGLKTLNKLIDYLVANSLNVNEYIFYSNY